VSHYNRIIEVMGCGIDIDTLQHCQPSHLYELACLAPEKDWGKWLNRCEKNKLSVSVLRGLLMKGAASKATVDAEQQVPSDKYHAAIFTEQWAGVVATDDG